MNLAHAITRGLALTSALSGAQAVRPPYGPRTQSLTDNNHPGARRLTGEGGAGLTAAPTGLVATEWFDVLLKMTRDTPGDSPPVAPRALAYAAVALYETVVPGMGVGATLAGQLKSFSAAPNVDTTAHYDWDTAASASLAEISMHLFPGADSSAASALADQYTAACQSQHADAVCHASQARGVSVAQAVLQWAELDGAANATLNNYPQDYVPPVGPGLWVPTPRNDQSAPLSALQPTYGATRPFVLGDVTDCTLPGPVPFSTDPTSPFYAQAKRVYDTVNVLSDDQRAAARFWADDAGPTPTNGGHAVAILSQVLRDKNASLTEAAEAYARVNMAVADGFITGWHTKYKYNLLRPVTYIQQYIDVGWLPFLDTPPFPEYASGHSVVSGAAFSTMTQLFGANYTFVDHSEDGGVYGVTGPRAFVSFAAAGLENGMSRLYGGVHYLMSIEDGISQGNCVASRVNALNYRSPQK